MFDSNSYSCLCFGEGLEHRREGWNLVEIVGSLISAATDRVGQLLTFIYGLVCGVVGWCVIVGSSAGIRSGMETANLSLDYLGVGATEWLREVQDWIDSRAELVAAVGWFLLLAGIVASLIDDHYRTSRTGSTLVLGAALIHESPTGGLTLAAVIGIMSGMTIVLVPVAAFAERHVTAFSDSIYTWPERLTRPIFYTVIGLLVPLTVLLWPFGGTERRTVPGTHPVAPLHVAMTN